MPVAPLPRFRFSRLVALAAFLASAALVGSAQQPAAEDEEPGGKINVKKRIKVDDDSFGGKAPVGNPPDVKLDELVRAAGEAKNPVLKAVFNRYVVPFDRLTEVSGAMSVKPVPYRRAEWGDLKEFDVTPLDAAGKARPERRITAANVRNLEHFESLLLAEADVLTKQNVEAAAVAEHLAAAETLLAAGLRFHEYARERQLRRGKTWDEVRTPLAERLREVRLEMLRAAIAANDPARTRDVGTLLLDAYPKDEAVAREVAAARLTEAERLLKSANHLDHIQARRILDDYEARFPGAGGEALKQARAALREMATKAFTRAKEKKAVGDDTTARDELARASDLDPNVEGVREMQRELRVGYPILHVGVRQFPVNMSPATARLDSEKQAVALMFEGLLEEVPEEDGSVRYRPGAALALPTSVPNGREFHLRSFDRDPAGRPGFDSQDVVGTLKLLGARTDTWAAYPLAWIGGLPTPRDASSIRIPFTLGHPDPRAALTFKILPARWMADNGKQADDPQFAEKPFGTGPFRLYSTPAAGGPREMVFVDNPVYGRWRDRTGLPHLREVRLVDVSKLGDPVKAFRDGKLQILTDVPTADIEKFTGPSSGLGGRVQVVTAKSNRRVHILAVNLQRSYLQNKPLRQGIMMAIDREDILREVFRAGKPQFHKAMTGPYPADSWANPKGIGGPPAIVNRDLAVERFRAYLSGTAPKTDLELAFPVDDPKAEDACRMIKSQIEGLTKDAPNGRRMVINLVGVPLRELITRVEGEHRYDLAYVPFDYPDDWHPYALGAMLDPQAAARGGRNWFSFLMPDTNPDAEDVRLGQMLTALRGYRNFAGELAPRAAEAAKLFNDCVPFVPLWQLDRHTAVHNSLKVYAGDGPTPASPRVLNPTVLFQGVARWRLD